MGVFFKLNTSIKYQLNLKLYIMMKKITLLFTFMIAFIGYAQVLPFNFDNSNQLMVGGDSANTFIVTEPGTTNKVLEFVGGNGSDWDNAQINFETQIDLSTPQTITFNLKLVSGTREAGSVLLKFESACNAGINSEQFFTTFDETSNAWQTITVTFPAAGEYGRMIIFPNAGKKSAATYYIDDIAVTGGATFSSASCSDCLLNQGEEEIDCGGSCVACVTPPPASTIPNETFATTSVFSTNSDNTNLIDVTNLNPYDFNGGTAFEEVDLGAGNKAFKYSNLNFVGGKWDGIDISSGFTTLHFDYYTTDATALEFFLINGTPQSEKTWNVSTDGTGIQTGTWVSIDIPLTHYTTGAGAITINDIYQYKIVGNGTIYFDNIYFISDTSLSTDDFDETSFSLYPNPTQDNWTVKTQSESISSITIFDVLGKNILSITPNTKEVVIDGSNLKTGLYFAQIKTALGVSGLKLIKN